MKPVKILAMLLLSINASLFAQTSYLSNQTLMDLADSCIQSIYALEFDRAASFHSDLQIRTPHHPAPPFLEALSIYWKYYPLDPEHEMSDTFIKLMEESVDRAAFLTGFEDSYLEGVFFDLFGRAFKAMFWADNGKTTRAASDLRIMYKRTKEGFILKDDFHEFYFSTGLYNYYIEAYPEAHPIYKPFVSFMEKGNMSLGIKQLQYAIDHSTFLKAEAMLFMALVQLNFEEDLNTAALYAERLYMLYPKNMYYQGLVATIWLHQHRYTKVEELLQATAMQKDPYSVLYRNVASGFLAEKKGREKDAAASYQGALHLGEEIGPMADMFISMAYMGLSRLHRDRGLKTAAKRYARKAGNHTPYAFILNEK